MTQGQLFNEYFLEAGIKDAPAFREISEAAVVALRHCIANVLSDFTERSGASEADTESDVIEPVLEALGWPAHIRQHNLSETGRRDVPDYLVFGDAESKATATKLAAAQRTKLGTIIVEGKAWMLPLDRAEPGAAGAPSTQIVRYLGTADVQSEGKLRFGVLTNGRVWRLYDQRSRARLEAYFEVDLADLVANTHQLKQFLFAFGRDGHRPDDHDIVPVARAVLGNRDFEAKVTDSLAERLFGQEFAKLAKALATADGQTLDAPPHGYLEALRDAALTWLYRLLFVLYAEDRNLVPTRDHPDGLFAIRKAVASAIDKSTPLSKTRTSFDDGLRALWRQIDIGDVELGLPPYNGGLFAPGRSGLLDRVRLPDAAFAPLLDLLSREHVFSVGRFINYRDLSVQHLGSVYEKLMEQELHLQAGALDLRPQAFARKTSGSYYTPESLVLLVIRRTVGPLIDRRIYAFEDAIERGVDPGPFDPAEAILGMKICDPAMGSGHFLVSLVDYLADRVLVEATSAADAIPGYRSPLLTRLANIRDVILANAKLHRWKVDPALLIDRLLVRRIILKRVIFGVDKNPTTVELAKLSLWLHTFTVGAPLSFLDHHLVCGDSLFGETAVSALQKLERLDQSAIPGRIAAAITAMDKIETLTDADIGEVELSKAEFARLDDQIGPVKRWFHLVQGYRWIEGSQHDALQMAARVERQGVRENNPKRAMEIARYAWNLRRRGSALENLLTSNLGDPDVVIDRCYGRIGVTEDWKAREEDPPELEPLLRAMWIARQTNFLHWELAFPGVWQDFLSAGKRSGGFDAIIGNPPWDRLKMQEVEWWAARRRDIAAQPRASDRKRMIAKLKTAGDPLSADYERARDLAELAATRANKREGDFPLLGKGDVNLYSLFVERALSLVKPDGLVGLLTPSGIAGDKSAAEFFATISTTGRLGTILDYANQPEVGARRFFDDVDSRFKFCLTVFGPRAGEFDATECGFFLTATEDEALSNQTFKMSAADFRAVNPNTATAPVFRSPRDAALVMDIYRRLPVLHRHTGGGGGGSAGDGAMMDMFGTAAAQRAGMPWPVEYLRMFDMTNDSHRFRTASELEKDGWFRSEKGHWGRKKDEDMVPLYVGRMFHQFDHRFNNVEVNTSNLIRAATSDAVSASNKAKPDFYPEPQYWVDKSEIPRRFDWTLAVRTIGISTNERSMISSIIPFCGLGNSAFALMMADASEAALLCGNFNSLVFDFVMRQKMQGTNINWYIVEQLPVVPPAGYTRSFGTTTARQLVIDTVLELSYTAYDLEPFAKAIGAVDDKDVVWRPYGWDPERRAQLRARLDALYFILTGVADGAVNTWQSDVDHIFSSFPIIAAADQTMWGRYRTRDLTKGWIRALLAGNPEATVVA